MKTFFYTLLFFAGAQATALFVANSLRNTPILKETVQNASISPLSFLMWIVIFTLLFFLARALFRPKHFNILVKLFFMFAIFSGIEFFVELITGDSIIALGIALIVAFIYFYISYAVSRNIIFTITAGTIAGIIGTALTSKDTIFIIGVFAIYDYIAVYYTKHMLTFAKAFLEANIVPGIVIPLDRKSSAQNIAASNLSLEVSRDNVLAQNSILGGGDLAFPAILTAAALKNGYTVAIATFFGAVLGLFILYKIFFAQQKRRAMPALPPLAAGSLFGFIIGIALQSLIY